MNPEGDEVEPRLALQKSSRHSRITGDFGEGLVLYWLSKYGFECARVDHTGIDLIARNPHNGELMGISVKSRSRNVGSEDTHVRIGIDDLKKASIACVAFACVPYFAIVVDAETLVRVFITSMSHLTTIHSPAQTAVCWKMRPSHLARYYDDPEVMIFDLETRTHRWWKGSELQSQTADS